MNQPRRRPNPLERPTPLTGQRCDYCGKTRPGPPIVLLGASAIDDKEPGSDSFAWVLWEGTALTSCDDRGCWQKGHDESRAAIDAVAKNSI